MGVKENKPKVPLPREIIMVIGPDLHDFKSEAIAAASSANVTLTILEHLQDENDIKQIKQKMVESIAAGNRPELYFDGHGTINSAFAHQIKLTFPEKAPISNTADLFSDLLNVYNKKWKEKYPKEQVPNKKGVLDSCFSQAFISNLNDSIVCNTEFLFSDSEYKSSYLYEGRQNILSNIRYANTEHAYLDILLHRTVYPQDAYVNLGGASLQVGVIDGAQLFDRSCAHIKERGLDSLKKASLANISHLPKQMRPDFIAALEKVTPENYLKQPHILAVMDYLAEPGKRYQSHYTYFKDKATYEKIISTSDPEILKTEIQKLDDDAKFRLLHNFISYDDKKYLPAIKELIAQGTDINISDGSEGSAYIRAVNNKLTPENLDAILATGKVKQEYINNSIEPLVKHSWHSVLEKIMPHSTIPNDEKIRIYTNALNTQHGGLCMKVLVENIDFHGLNNDKQFALMQEMLKNDRVEDIKIAMTRGLNIHSNGPDNYSILHYAKTEGQVNDLIQLGCNVNAASTDGVTPILALMSAQVEPTAIKALIDAGANTNIINKGITLMDRAMEMENYEVVNLLRGTFDRNQQPLKGVLENYYGSERVVIHSEYIRLTAIAKNYDLELKLDLNSKTAKIGNHTLPLEISEVYLRELKTKDLNETMRKATADFKMDMEEITEILLMAKVKGEKVNMQMDGPGCMFSVKNGPWHTAVLDKPIPDIVK